LPSDPAPDILDPADSRPASGSVLGDWLALQRGLGLKPQKAAELLRRHRHPALALAQSGLSTTAFDPNAEIAALLRVGAVGVPLHSAAYPARLASLSDPAPLLLVRGDVRALSELSVAIVGARAATVYGKQVARGLAADLAREGVVIVSGLARGVDAEAHRGALEAGGRTVAVQACGIDRIYPREHRALADEIAANGAVVSELPLGEPPLRQYFPLRNRLISGLSTAVVIVEARERSGSLITANHAANQGRDVFAVPGPITAPTSVGTNRLIRDGAYVVLGADEICGELGLIREPRSRPRITCDLSGLSREILSALADAPASRDELARRLGRGPAEFALELIELELANRIAEDRDGRLQIVSRLG
jgi:DNA processing protein